MSVDANKEFVRRFHQAVMVERKLDDAARYLSDPFIDHAAPGEETSVEQYRQSLTGYFTAFPDLKAEVADLTADDDFVVLRIDMSGTSSAPFMGAPPSGKTFSIGSIQTYRIEDDKIVERWQYIDLLGLRTQLGIQN